MTITFVATRKAGLRPGNELGGYGSNECVNGNVAAMITETDAFRKSDSFQRLKSPEEEPLWFRGSAGDTFTSLGLVGTALEAYNKHQNLVLRPDDIWNTLLTQFCAYVNANAEALRHKFVLHKDGKQTLVVIDPNNDPASADYAWFIHAMVDAMTDHLVEPDQLKEWYLPGFSTTTERDQVCAAATLMCTMQSYFVYEMMTMCGVPKVTLEGSVEDWKLLRSKVDRFSEFHVPTNVEGSSDKESPYLDQWIPAIKMICDNLVESAQTGSNTNLDFWENMIVRNGGSGGPYLRGWMVCFTFFDEKGQPSVHIDLDRIRKKNEWPKRRLGGCNPNVVSCPVTIKNLANGNVHPARLFVGQMSYNIQNDGDTEEEALSAVFAQGLTNEQTKKRKQLVPRNDWVLCIDAKPENESAGS